MSPTARGFKHRVKYAVVYFPMGVAGHVIVPESTEIHKDFNNVPMLNL